MKDYNNWVSPAQVTNSIDEQNLSLYSDVNLSKERPNSNQNLVSFPVTKFNKPLKNVETTEFEEAIDFVCEVSLPQAKVTWLKDGLPLEEGPKYTVVEEGPVRRLVVKDVAKQDEAGYTCVVGEQKTQAELFVESEYSLLLNLKKIMCWGCVCGRGTED